MSEWNRDQDARDARVERLYSARATEPEAERSFAPAERNDASLASRRRRRRAERSDADEANVAETPPSKPLARSPFAPPADPFAPYDEPTYNEADYVPNDEPSKAEPLSKAETEVGDEPSPDYSAR